MVSQDYNELSVGFQVMTLCIENATNGKMIYTDCLKTPIHDLM